jgi:hypothetical protein
MNDVINKVCPTSFWEQSNFVLTNNHVELVMFISTIYVHKGGVVQITHYNNKKNINPFTFINYMFNLYFS